MERQERWNDRYINGDLPWDTGRPDAHLQRVVREHPITPCPTLELGCGTGTNAIWLAQKGFTVIALDLSSEAIAAAQSKAPGGNNPVFMAFDLIEAQPLPATDCGFVFDRGCFHSLDSQNEREALVVRLAQHMHDHALWLSIIGSSDGPTREVGPPRMTAVQIAEVVEPHFEILELRADLFDSHHETPPRAWVALFRKRPAPGAERPTPF